MPQPVLRGFVNECDACGWSDNRVHKSRPQAERALAAHRPRCPVAAALAHVAGWPS